MKYTVSLATSVLLALAGFASADSGTEFTYQGRLNYNNSSLPITAKASFRFSLHDHPTTGTQIGSPNERVNTTVHSGLFTEKLDFGNVFDGKALWLEIEVDADGGTDNFVLFDDRVQIQPVPSAIFATRSETAGTVESLGNQIILEPEINFFGSLGGLDLNTNVVVDGDYAYYTTGAFDRLRIIDVSDPTNPIQVGSTRNPSTFTNDVAIKGNLAFVTVGGSSPQLVSYDISDKTTPMQLSTLVLFEGAADISIDGDYAYILRKSTINRNISSVDISDPGNMTLLDTSDQLSFQSAAPNRLSRSGDLLFTITGRGWLSIVDKSDPSNLDVLYNGPIKGGASSILDRGIELDDVVVVGNYAYISVDGKALHTLDITDPTVPSTINIIEDDIAIRINRIVHSGGILYLCSNDSEVSILSLKNPAAPRFIKTVPTQSSVFDAVVAAGKLYITTNVLYIYDLSSQVFATELVTANISVSDKANVRSLEFADGTVQTTAFTGMDNVEDADADPTNELQNIAEVLGDGNDANGASITSLGSVSASSFSGDGSGLTGIDTDQTNEFQDLSFSGGQLSLSDDTTVNLNALADGDGDVDALFINNNGNVGIGTDSPSKALDIQGELQVGFLVDNNSIVDVEQLNDGFSFLSGSNDVFWQSFTATTTGALSSVEIRTGPFGTNDLRSVTVYEGTGIEGTELTKVTVNSTYGMNTWLEVSLPEPPLIQKNSVYTMAFETPRIFLSTGDALAVYDGGEASFDPDSDLAFRTNVLPESDVMGVFFPDGTVQTTAFTGSADDADPDPTNEFQNLSFSGGQLTLSEDTTVNVSALTDGNGNPGALIVNNTGNVGIRTSAPSEMLEVAGGIKLSDLFADQVNYAGGSRIGAASFWQSFTPSVSGDLAAMEFRMDGNESGTYNLYLGQGTGGNLLTTGSFATIDGAFQKRIVLVNPEAVVAETVYTFEIVFDANSAILFAGSGNFYPRGRSHFDSGRDFHFATYMLGPDSSLTFSDGTIQTTAFTGDTDDADSDPTNELQNLAEVLSRGNNAGGASITNLGSVSTGEVEFGSSRQYNPVGSTTAAATVVGRVTALGVPVTTVTNLGFTSTRNSKGVYTITFTTTFADDPIVTANIVGTNTRFASIQSTSTSTCVIRIRDRSGDEQDEPFNFIAIGER